MAIEVRYRVAMDPANEGLDVLVIDQLVGVLPPLLSHPPFFSSRPYFSSSLIALLLRSSFPFPLAALRFFPTPLFSRWWTYGAELKWKYDHDIWPRRGEPLFSAIPGEGRRGGGGGGGGGS